MSYAPVYVMEEFPELEESLSVIIETPELLRRLLEDSPIQNINNTFSIYYCLHSKKCWGILFGSPEYSYLLTYRSETYPKSQCLSVFGFGLWLLVWVRKYLMLHSKIVTECVSQSILMNFQMNLCNVNHYVMYSRNIVTI